jgi:hypothetical protein
MAIRDDFGCFNTKKWEIFEVMDMLITLIWSLHAIYIYQTITLCFINMYNKTFVFQWTTPRKWKDNLKNGSDSLQIVYKIRDMFSWYIKNSFNSTIKRQKWPNLNMDNGCK